MTISNQIYICYTPCSRSQTQILHLLTRFEAPAYVWLWMHLSRGVDVLHDAKNCVILEKKDISSQTQMTQLE